MRRASPGRPPRRARPAEGSNLDERAPSESPSASPTTEALFEALSAAGGAEAFQRSWLALQCRMIPGVMGGLLLLGPPDTGPFRAVAVWPRVYGDLEPLTRAAERALEERSGLVLRPDEGAAGRRDRVQIAQPLLIDDALVGVVVLDAAPRDESALSDALWQLRWGSGWLAAQSAAEPERRTAERNERLRSVLELAAGVADGGGFRETATRLATELATRLDCDRVGVGFLERGRIALAALSHSAEFSAKANLSRAIEAAMEEAVAQNAPVEHPAPDDAGAVLARAQAALAERTGAAAVLSVPLVRGDAVCGALTLERDRAFDASDRTVCDALAALVGPMLEAMRRDQQGAIAALREALGEAVSRLLGPAHVASKLMFLLLAATLLVLLFARADYRVTARSVVEAETQRAAVAPFDGFIAEAPVRAGDLVAKGDLLFRLDDRDLALERARLASQLTELEKEHRQALADREPAGLRIASARLAQARARLALAEDRLARVAAFAPFDGYVVRGDLSQSLGAPVERGDVLFEIAPLDSFRLALEVDERDVREIRPGQTGSLVLAASPLAALPFEVRSVTPISSAAEGRNFFRVEAELAKRPTGLRPGMEGVGKIDVDRRRIVWLLGHRLSSRLRMLLWTWGP